jgi:hypothetical protein
MKASSIKYKHIRKQASKDKEAVVRKEVREREIFLFHYHLMLSW